jgi:cytosine/adenosine deaminase-related metal-dependent hydrolase
VGPGAWPADQALHAATRGGARALGLETELGSLEPGKRADILLWDLASLEPDGAAVSSLVYRATEACLSQVYLGGQKVVENGQVAGMEDALIRNEAREQRDAVLGRAGVSR